MEVGTSREVIAVGLNSSFLMVYEVIARVHEHVTQTQ